RQGPDPSNNKQQKAAARVMVQQPFMDHVRGALFAARQTSPTARPARAGQTQPSPSEQKGSQRPAASSSPPSGSAACAPAGRALRRSSTAAGRVKAVTLR